MSSCHGPEIQSAAVPAGSAGRVRIVYRAGDVGESGARALAARLQAQDIAVDSRSVAHDAGARAVVDAVRSAAKADTLVLWLRPGDLAVLAAVPPPAGQVYLSGGMANLDVATLPSAWAEHALISYPVDLPEQRRVRVDYALAWFRIRRLPVVAEQVQVDTHLACGLVAETIKHMVDAFIPDYLVERLEDSVGHRVITGYYPRLALGPNQRIASKGGYLVHLGPAGGPRLIPAGDWMTP
jgi:hypothetical protein